MAFDLFVHKNSQQTNGVSLSPLFGWQENRRKVRKESKTEKQQWKCKSQGVEWHKKKFSFIPKKNLKKKILRFLGNQTDKRDGES